jgi:hypothetical protein
MKTAKEMFEIATSSHAQNIFKRIEEAAQKGEFVIWVKCDEINKITLKELKENGYSFEYIKGERELDEDPEYAISWDKK